MKENIGYRGNRNLKRPNKKVEWTADLIREYKRCKDDIIYFAENYYKAITEDGLVKIKLRPYQKKMIRSMVDNRFTISAQSRQSGKCFSINTPIRIRNKKTGEIVLTTIGELYNEEKTKTLQTMQNNDNESSTLQIEDILL